MENNMEQPDLKKEGSNEFGKFKDAESLLKAYNNLQTEFTKKSQRLADLENQKLTDQTEFEKKVEQEKRIDEFVNKFDAFKPFSGALKESLNKSENADIKEEAFKLLLESYKSPEDYLRDEEFLKNHIFSNHEIKDKIIKDYLIKVTQQTPIKVSDSGSSISLTPPNIPSTIQEAGRLAKSIIKQK